MVDMRFWSTEHPQKLIEHHGCSAEVDEELADLILACWDVEIHTVLSCQGDGPDGQVMISFPSGWDAEKFLVVTVGDKFDNTPGSLWSRTFGHHHGAPGHWEVHAYLRDANSYVETDENGDDGDEVSDGEVIGQVRITIRFPRADLPVVRKAFCI